MKPNTLEAAQPGNNIFFEHPHPKTVIASYCARNINVSDSWRIGGKNITGYSAVRHGKDTPRLGTAGILCGWALQG